MSIRTARFRELRFQSQQAFDNWLDDYTFKKIHLKDFGQDMTLICVLESGEILHSNFHGRIYAGQFIDMEKLAVGKKIVIFDNETGDAITYHKLIVEALK